MSGGSPSGPARILVAGPAYCDLLFSGLDGIPAAGTERFAASFAVTAGGSAIVAVALARLGRPVALLADLGDDPLGASVDAVLAAEGVDVRWLRRPPGAHTPVTAVLSTPADRAFVTHLPPPPRPPELEAALEGFGAHHLHLGGFPVTQARPDAVDVARARGVTTSFDPGWDAAALADPRVWHVATTCDVLLPNRREAAHLSGRGAPAREDATAAQSLARLADVRPGRVTVVKDGAAGALARKDEQDVAEPAPNVQAVDPTGAGDVFDAGFLDAWLEGASLRACLRRGVACGARSVGAVGGATAAPRRAELEVPE